MKENSKQILLLGDSIRMQYQPVVGQKLADIAEVSGPEENGRWSGYTLTRTAFHTAGGMPPA